MVSIWLHIIIHFKQQANIISHLQTETIRIIQVDFEPFKLSYNGGGG